MNANTSIMPRREQAGHWNWRVQQLLLTRLSKLEHGVLQVSFDDGGRYTLEGAQAGPGGDIQVHRPAALLRAVALRGDLGFAESYMRGDWSSRDLPALLYLVSINLEAYARDQRRSLPVRLLARLQHVLKRNSRRGSRRNIAAHYDLGNDFYARWLDTTMSYSSAVYDRSFDLAKAQERKYELMLAQLDPEPGDHVLEIGCGLWVTVLRIHLNNPTRTFCHTDSVLKTFLSIHVKKSQCSSLPVRG